MLLILESYTFPLCITPPTCDLAGSQKPSIGFSAYFHSFRDFTGGKLPLKIYTVINTLYFKLGGLKLCVQDEIALLNV